MVVLSLAAVDRCLNSPIVFLCMIHTHGNPNSLIQVSVSLKLGISDFDIGYISTYSTSPLVYPCNRNSNSYATLPKSSKNWKILERGSKELTLKLLTI